ncbi:LysR family transcriptional regulator [Microlunatus parietis]|uniref:DNA-binding transcriptional LysR family regulator n=1 Tax=Microlunatus parietis TaxID=682979 RepID=A0A7Y9I6B3_9ACTN|nr:LysR family transcriptional regulator [Microlunatus parietis]NYE70932.1 DNA-binding transcriptional LysR family regulator [Microlunatus parietis]
MEVHQLRYALAVADERSFTAAAQVLHVSQSGVSAQVALLERELGLTLFDRSARGVRVTPAGSPVLDQLRRALTELDRVRAVADELNGLVRGTVSIGAVAGLGWPAFLDALQQVHRTHPGLELSLREAKSVDLQEDVAAGRLDLAVATWVDRPREGLGSWVALEERVIAAVGTDHPWAGRSRISPADLLDQPVVGLAPGTGMRSSYDAMMRAEGLPAPVSWEVTLPTTARALAARGLGVAVLTSSRADLPTDLVRLKINSKHATSRLGVVWRTRPAPTAGARATLEAFREHLAVRS